MYKESSNELQGNVNNTLSSMYSKYIVSKILQEYISNTNEEYHHVISIRFDFLNKLNFKIEEMIHNKINIMNISPRLYISDHLIISNYNNFIKHSNVYENLYKILENIFWKTYLDNIKCGYGFVSETLATANLLIYYQDLYSIINLHNKIPLFCKK